MRPIFLVLDPPDPEALSTRKLVLETAKFNVVTAYTGMEALEVAERVPVDAIVLHSRAHAQDFGGLLQQMKERCGNIPVIVTSPNGQNFPFADHVISSHDPVALLDLVHSLFGYPTPSGGVSKSPEPTDFSPQNPKK